MSNGLQITTTKDYFVFKVPKEIVIKGLLSSAGRKLTEDEALKIFDKGKKEYLSGKLREVADLSQLLR